MSDDTHSLIAEFPSCDLVAELVKRAGAKGQVFVALRDDDDGDVEVQVVGLKSTILGHLVGLTDALRADIASGIAIALDNLNDDEDGEEGVLA